MTYKVEGPKVGLYHIKAEGRGSVNKSLRGAYNSKALAQKAIDTYEEKKNASTASGSRSK